VERYPNPLYIDNGGFKSEYRSVKKPCKVGHAGNIGEDVYEWRKKYGSLACGPNVCCMVGLKRFSSEITMLILLKVP